MKFFTETQNLFCDYLVGHEEAKIAQRKDLLSLPVVRFTYNFPYSFMHSCSPQPYPVVSA